MKNIFIVGTTRPLHRIKQDFEDECYPGLKTRWYVGYRLISMNNPTEYTFDRVGEYLVTCKIYDIHFNLLDSTTQKVRIVSPGEVGVLKKMMQSCG